jgi:hypothetical protein
MGGFFECPKKFSTISKLILKLISLIRENMERGKDDAISQFERRLKTNVRGYVAV